MPITSPVGIGYQVPLNGGTGNPQTYTVTSSNPDIKATVAQGKFLTVNVTHTSSGAGDLSFTGSLTFQLFDDLTPLTTSRIETLVEQGFYSGKNFHRIANMFPGVNDYIVQGGSVNGNGTGDVNQPGFPFSDEFVQQLAFTGTGQLAMANAGDDTNGSQFFITTGSPRFLDYQHTIFGQLVAGQPVLQQMTQVAKGTDGTTPVSPITITSATLSNTDPNGVIHIDTTQATADETSTVTVTATDPSTNTTATQTFTVTAAANVDPSTGQPVPERPFLMPVQNQVVGAIATTPTVQGQTDVFQLQGVDANAGDQLTYIVKGGVTTGSTPTFTDVQNATASVDANGVVTVVPNKGFTGVINLLVGVRDQSNPTNSSDINAPGNFDTQKITLTVNNGAPVNLPPIAISGSTSIVANTPTTVQLQGVTGNPDATSQTLTYELVSPPSVGTVSGFNPQTGTFTYTPPANFQGTQTVTFRVTDQGAPTPNLTSNLATETLTVGGTTTGNVRLIGRVLVVQAPARTDSQGNTINVSLVNGHIQVMVNGLIDSIQPDPANIDRLIVNGSKSSDSITVAPDVNVITTLAGGLGGKNVIDAGGGPTRLHGWYGRNLLQGGPQHDELVGQVGHVRFRQSSGADLFFKGQPFDPSTLHHFRKAPNGTFYKMFNSKIVPIGTPAARKAAITPAPVVVGPTPTSSGSSTSGGTATTTSNKPKGEVGSVLDLFQHRTQTAQQLTPRQRLANYLRDHPSLQRKKSSG